MTPLYNPFSKNPETGQVPLFKIPSILGSSNRNADVGKTDAGSEQESTTTEYREPMLTAMPPTDTPDIDTVVAYMIQFASKIGKLSAEGTETGMHDNILEMRNFRGLLYFADWEFSRRNERRLTDIIWYTSDYDYNVNTSSRFDVILDSDIFDFDYRSVGEKHKNQMLYRINLKPEVLDYDFSLHLEEEVKAHIEHIIAAYTISSVRPRTFPASYEPKGGYRTYHDLDLLEIAKIERYEHRVFVSPLMVLETKKFNPATFATVRNSIQQSFHRSVEDHDPRFANALHNVIEDQFFIQHPERLFIRVLFDYPIWETDDQIFLVQDDPETGYGTEYVIRMKGHTSDIFCYLTDDEYNNLTESQQEFFKLAPAADFEGGMEIEDQKMFQFQGECKVALECNVTIDPTDPKKVSTNFSKVKFRLV